MTWCLISAVEFGLSAFPRDSQNTNPYPAHDPYGPTPLQIPTHSQRSEHSPSAYIPSAASTLASSTFTFPPSSESRSLSPGGHTGWTDPSSPLSLGPHDGATTTPSDLSFDTELAHLSFPINLHPPQPPLHLLPSSHPHPSRDNTRLRISNGVASPSTHSSSSHNSEIPCVKLGPNGLSADQPPTAQGKLRTRVYVACLQWFVISMCFFYVRLVLSSQ